MHARARELESIFHLAAFHLAIMDYFSGLKEKW